MNTSTEWIIRSWIKHFQFIAKFITEFLKLLFIIYNIDIIYNMIYIYILLTYHKDVKKKMFQPSIPC